MKNEIVYISFGSNLGKRKENVEMAIDMIKAHAENTVLYVSKFIETEPVGGPEGQSKYLNGVIKVQTSFEAHQLLKYLNLIEAELGRVRSVRNGPRPIDLDILLYGDEIINTDDLTIPHPRMFERGFVLKPLLQIEPTIVDTHPQVIPYKQQIESIV